MFKKVDIYAKSLRETITIINDSISTATVKVATDNTGARELTFIRIYTYKHYTHTNKNSHPKKLNSRTPFKNKYP